MKTTKLQFWRTLKSLATNDWVIAQRSNIRLQQDYRLICPVCAVANAILGEISLFNTGWTSAAQAIGFDPEYATLIACAFDHDLTRSLAADRISEVRALLKRTLGLT